jgi:hypothetical protein
LERENGPFLSQVWKSEVKSQDTLMIRILRDLKIVPVKLKVLKKEMKMWFRADTVLDPLT